MGDWKTRALLAEEQLGAAVGALREVRPALDLAHQVLLGYRFPAGSTPEELDREASKAIKIATRALAATDLAAAASDGQGAAKPLATRVYEHMDTWHTEHGDYEFPECVYPECEALRAILGPAPDAAQKGEA